VKRILITGGRDWKDSNLIRQALLENGPGIVVHGACRGADTLANDAAQALGWPTEAHPANFYPLGKYDRAAGNKRNAKMVALGADICLAFPDPQSKGTWNCVNLAKRAKIEVLVFAPGRS
jgi:hypothetical protein